MTKQKKGTKAAAKQPAAKKKPVTMAERVKHIELDVNRHGVSLDARVRQLHDLVAVIAAQLGRMEPRLDKIENRLSLILSGQSFMQELEQAQPTEKLGLTPVVVEEWKPEVGQYVKPSAIAQEDWVLGELRSGVIERVSEGKLWVREIDGKTWDGVFPWRYEPMSPEEVAKYHTDIEAAKPITPFTTRVKTTGGEEWLVIHGPSPGGHYTIQREVDGYCDTRMAERHKFTVI